MVRMSYLGVPTMARPRTTTTTRKAPTTTRAPKAPTAPQKAPTAQRGASKDGAKTTAKGKANVFDDIARATAAGDDDLARKLQASISDAKAKRGPKSANAASAKSDGKVDAKPKGRPKSASAASPAPKSAFAGRPVSDSAKVQARVKQLGLRPRANVDIDALAVQLRATPDAVTAWLAARDGSAPSAKATTAKPAPKAKAKPNAPAKLAVTLRHPWVDREPDYLRHCTLVVDYRVDADDGHVTMQIRAIEGPDGKVLPDRGRDLPVDFRPVVQTLDNGRKIVLKDRTIAGLTAWLAKEGLTEQQ
jgi:hypothetical protein